MARMEAQGAAANGKLYVFGGFHTVNLHATRRVDAYDPVTNSWARVADLPEALTHSAVAVDGHRIYLIGGFVGNHPGPSTRHVWIYDTIANTWSAGPSLPADRGAGAAVILDRHLHFFGGGTRVAGVVDIVDQGSHYVLALDGGTRWTSSMPIPNPRNHLAGAALGGKIYAIGGQHHRNEVTGDLSEVDAYNPATNTWTRVADLPSPRGHISTSTFVLNKRIFVIGGTLRGDTNGLPAADVTAYDPRTNTWQQLTALPAGRKSPVADVIGQQIVVATGNATSIAAPSATTWTGKFTGG
jgi:N-acetylneuraminic acid mutarotase